MSSLRWGISARRVWRSHSARRDLRDVPERARLRSERSVSRLRQHRSARGLVSACRGRDHAAPTHARTARSQNPVGRPGSVRPPMHPSEAIPQFASRAKTHLRQGRRALRQLDDVCRELLRRQAVRDLRLRHVPVIRRLRDQRSPNGVGGSV
jgi:hypothetical protein